MPLFSHWQKCKLHQLCFNHLPERHRPQVFTDRSWNSSPSQPWLNPWLFSCTRPKSVLLSWALDFQHHLKQLVYLYLLSPLLHYPNAIPMLFVFPYSLDISKARLSILTISKAVNVARCTPKYWYHQVPFVLHWQPFQSNRRLSISQRYSVLLGSTTYRAISQCIALSLHVWYIISTSI